MSKDRKRRAARIGATIGAGALLVTTAPAVGADEHDDGVLPLPPEELTLAQAGFSVPAATCDSPIVTPIVNDELGLPTDATFVTITVVGGADGEADGDVTPVAYALTSGSISIGGAGELELPEETSVTGSWDASTGAFAGTLSIPSFVLPVEVGDTALDVPVTITTTELVGTIDPETFGGTLTTTATIELFVELLDATCTIGPIDLALGTDPVEPPEPVEPPAPSPPTPVQEAQPAPAPAPAAPVRVEPRFTG